MADMLKLMGESIPEFINQLFTWEMLLALVVGIGGGLLIGALPGLNPAAGITLLLPLTYTMSPVASLTMLTAIYAAGIMGGSYSAILLRTPGTSSAAATVTDGHALALKGQPLKALQVSTFSSGIGGIISAIALLFISPMLARVSIKFDSPEYFLLGLFGITIIASLASDSLLKGMISGLFGMCLSCIGQFPLESTYRYTFGIRALQTGLNSTVILLGLFSVSQVIIQVDRQRRGAVHTGKVEMVKLSGKGMDSSDWKRVLPIIMVCSVIGIFVGILPGAGAAIGAFIGYDQAKRMSKKENKAEFGQGAVEGIAGPEAANNAVTGGALIPMMTLSIPGSPVAAILLSALMIHGLTPGFSLFTEHASDTYPILFGFLLTNIIMIPLGLLFVRGMKKVVDLPPAVLYSVIIVLVFVGTYSISHSVSDLIVVAIFGLFGYFTRLCHYNDSGLCLGLILGTMTEKGLRRSFQLCRGDIVAYFLARPVCIALMILLVIVLIIPLIKAIRKKAQKKKDLFTEGA